MELVTVNITSVPITVYHRGGERPSFAECISNEMKVGVLADLQWSDCEEQTQ